MVFDATRVEEEAGAGGAPPLGRLPDRPLGHTSYFGGCGSGPGPAVLFNLLKLERELIDEFVVEPVVLNHLLQHTGEQCRIAPRLHREKEIARPSDGRDPWILHDDFCSLLARLPDVVGRDRRAFRDVRTGDPDHVSSDHIGPGVCSAVDAKGFLVGGAGAYHAEAAVVVDVWRLETDARKFAQQVGLLSRETGAAKHTNGAVPVSLLNPAECRGDLGNPLVISDRSESASGRRIVAERRQEPIGVRTLEVALDPLGTQHPAIERELLPGLEADDLVVPDLQ